MRQPHRKITPLVRASSVIEFLETRRLFSNPVSAPTADAGGPYFTIEGGSTTLDGSASTDAEQDPVTLTYEWDLDGDNTFGETGAGAANGDETGITPTFVTNGLDGQASYTIKLRVTDINNLSNTAETSITVFNEPPLPAFFPPDGLEPGVAANFRFFTSDPSTADNDAKFGNVIDFGDGTTPISISPADEINTSKSYAAPGIYRITYTASDKDGGTSQIAKDATVSGVQIITDPTDPSKKALIVVGTTGSDTIKVLKGTSDRGMKVVINGRNYGNNFRVTGKLIILGSDGDDTITVNDAINRDSMIYGGNDEDTIKSGKGNSVVIAGFGNDTIFTGVHRDVAIGGPGADTIKKSTGEDLLIAVGTAYDRYAPADVIALSNLVTEWNRKDLNYAARVDRLLGNTPGSTFVFHTSTNEQNVFEDFEVDNLVGGQDKDWFFANSTGIGSIDVTDRTGSEILTDVESE